MTKPVVILKHPDGRRLYVVSRRVHHGTWGVAALVAGLVLAWQDRKDFKEWLPRERLP